MIQNCSHLLKGLYFRNLHMTQIYKDFFTALIAAMTFSIHSASKTFLYEEGKQPMECNVRGPFPFEKEFIDNWFLPTANTLVIQLNKYTTKQADYVLNPRDFSDRSLNFLCCIPPIANMCLLLFNLCYHCSDVY